MIWNWWLEGKLYGAVRPPVESALGSAASGETKALLHNPDKSYDPTPYTYINVYTYIHAYIHTYIHTYISTYILNVNPINLRAMNP